MDLYIKHKINTLIENTNHDLYSKNEFIIVFGPMGSGKSTFIKNNLNDSDKIYISIDEYIDEMYYNTGIDIETLYNKARLIGEAYTNYLLDNNISMIVEGTGKNKDVITFLNNLKKNGYNISMYIFNTSVETCIERIKIRNEMIDRKIPEEAVYDAHEKLHNNWNELVKYADKLEII